MAENMTVRCNSGRPSVRSTWTQLSDVACCLLARTFRLFPNSPVGIVSSCHHGLHRLRWRHRLTCRARRRGRTHSSNFPSPGRVLPEPRLRSSRVSSHPIARCRFLQPSFRCSPYWQSGTGSCFRQMHHVAHRVRAEHHRVATHHWRSPAALTGGVGELV